ncbi:MAG: sigma-54 dependent transcriptional regulator, partial [Polyangiaceae bacterium]
LGSRNGTTVTGAAVGDDPIVAVVGSFLRLGNTILRVVADIAAFSHHVSDGGAFVGGPSAVEIRKQVRHAAGAELPVLIEGESGVGKELVAQSLHEQSQRRGELVAVNCAAIPDELIEAELFGHAKGAFSGAEGSRVGLIRSADGGTLFLDEIGEMPLETQAKLLRALETREVRPVGEDRVQNVDVRFVSATNAPLDEHVSDGVFREDLFHRIAAIRLVVPPLRERAEDVPMLVCHFAGRGALPTTAAMELLCGYRWPGNVRELRNAVAVARHAAGAEVIAVEHLPQTLRDRRPTTEHDQERARYESALAAAKGNIAAVARQLGMRRATVYEHLRRLDIDAKRFRG